MFTINLSHINIKDQTDLFNKDQIDAYTFFKISFLTNGCKRTPSDLNAFDKIMFLKI